MRNQIEKKSEIKFWKKVKKNFKGKNWKKTKQAKKWIKKILKRISTIFDIKIKQNQMKKMMKLKKNLKKNLKQWKTNQKKEDYNWNTK